MNPYLPSTKGSALATSIKCLHIFFVRYGKMTSSHAICNGGDQPFTLPKTGRAMLLKRIDDKHWHPRLPITHHHA
jgi:hypothetical protein